MAGETTSPYMSLIIPAVGVTDWLDAAPDINTSLTLIDQHNHASGNGVAISPPGLDINEDLSFQSNDAVDLRSTRFTSQASPIGDPSDLGCLYVAGVDLYYNDENGNQIRITASGGVAGSPGSIGNLTPPASVTYVNATPAYVFQSDANTSANLDAGSLTIRENVASAKGITLNSPTGLANDYSITFPGALPGSNKIVRLDASGNLSATLGVDGSTIVISANNLAVGTITDSQIAAGSIDADRLVFHSVTKLQIVSDPLFAGTQFGSESGPYLTTTTGAGNYKLNNHTQSTLLTSYESAAGSGQGYRVILGQVDGTTGGLIRGEGWSSVRNSAGYYTITLAIAGSNLPVLTTTPTGGSGAPATIVVNMLSTTVIDVFTSLLSVSAGNLVTTLANTSFNFIAIIPVA